MRPINSCVSIWRVLIVDDNRSIHDDFRKIFESINQARDRSLSFEHIFEGEESTEATLIEEGSVFETEFAFNGEEALEMVCQAKAEGRPYSVVFMDVRMPPHEDGVRALQKIWEVDPQIQAVLCSAYSDYTWDELTEVLDINDQLLLIRKPFYVDEIRQAAFALSIKRDTHQALTDALKKADMAAKAKESFLSVMNHEMRTPLNSIIGFSSLLNQPQPDSEACKDYAHKINEAGYRLLGMVTDIIEYSRLTASDFRLKEKTFVLKDHILDLAERARERAEVKGLGFELHVDPRFDQQLYRGDGARLSGMIRHLLDNAVKFTASGKVELIATDCTSTEHQYNVQVRVSDTGVGISKEGREELFKMFHQGDLSNTRKFSGIGVGLAILKATLEHMDGRVEIESEQGEGATFTLQVALETEAP